MSPSDFGEILKPFVFLDLLGRTRGFQLWIALPRELELGPVTSMYQVASGTVAVPDELRDGELAAFEPSSQAVEFEARTDAEFVVGSAVPHEYDLVLGSHSVHTTPAALRDAQAHLWALRRRLVQEGRL